MFDEKPADAVGGNSRPVQELTIGGTRLEHGHQRHAGVDRVGHGFDVTHDRRREWRRHGQRPANLERTHLYLRIIDGLLEYLAHLLDAAARIDAAIHVRARALRQRVAGVAAFERRGHAGGAEHRIVRGIRNHRAQRLRVCGVCQESLHGSAHRAAEDLAHAREVQTRGVIQLHWKFELTHVAECCCEMVDRVVLHGA